ncbi:MAG: hypothetical protein J5940_00885 [Clostridia bacterium]|nr:hypothetical protein [Clostridia bacterium]
MTYTLRNIIRFPKKTAVMFIIVSILLLLSMSGIFIIRLCGEISSRTVGPLGGTVVVTDENGGRAMYYEAAKVLKDNSDVITDIDAVAEYPVQGVGITGIGGDEYIIEATSLLRYTREKAETITTASTVRDLKLCAVTTTDICPEFYGGDAVITSGTSISREDCENITMKAVVSDEFAEKNGLSLGDRIRINALSVFISEPDIAYMSAYGLPDEAVFFYDDFAVDLGESLTYITFTIGGIYHNGADNRNVVSEPSSVNANKIYIPISAISKKLEIINKDEIFNSHLGEYINLKKHTSGMNFANQYVHPEDIRCLPTRMYFRLSSLSLAEELENALNSLGFYQTIKLTEFINEAGASPAAQILGTVRFSLIGVVAVGFVVLLLIMIFNMNSRKREFAVLAALGKKRSSITASFLSEVLIVFIVALLICALVFGFAVNSVASPISEYLEAEETAAAGSEIRLSSTYSESEAKEVRSRNMNDSGYLTEEFTVPAVTTTAAGLAAVILLMSIPAAIFIKARNPLTDAGGKG